MVDAVYLDDRHPVASNAEGEETVRRAVDNSKAVALALRDVDASPGCLWPADVAPLTINRAAVHNL